MTMATLWSEPKTTASTEFMSDGMEKYMAAMRSDGTAARKAEMAGPTSEERAVTRKMRASLFRCQNELKKPTRMKRKTEKARM